MIAEPVALAPDVFVVPAFWRPAGSPVGLQVCSLVLGGRRAVLVDTSLGVDADTWLDVVCSLVDPDHLHTVVLSGRGPAHRGGLEVVRAAAPGAEVVDATRCALPSELRAGDRRLRLHAAPGAGVAVFDEGSRVLWSALLAMPLPRLVTDVAALEDGDLADALVSPHAGAWATLLHATGPAALAGPHGPAATGRGLDRVVAALSGGQPTLASRRPVGPDPR